MKIKTFIDRPILAGVISVLILILGSISLFQLPIEQFPEIAPPTVSVSATYTGANAETVQKSVVIPLEEALNGVENMMYMTSTASNNGSAKITVYFRQGTDPDMATVNVQNRIATAEGLLPAEVTKSGITVRKRQTSNIKQLAVYSPDDRFDEAFLTNYMKINIEPRLSRIAGVGEVNVFGYEYSMRIWLDPNKMQKYSLVPSDITTVLSEQNIEAATGTLGAESENTFQYVLKYRGRYENEVDYENMVIKSLPNGEMLRLKDVATVELGTRAYDYIGEVNGHPGCNIMIAQTSGSNANEIIAVRDSDSIEEVTQTIEKYDLVALPVIDSIGRLVGRISVDDVMDEVREQHERDYQLASGISQDVEASDNIFTQTAARLPWLLIGMIGGLSNSIILGGFETGIATNPKMALFIPLIGGTGGNVGIQSSAIVVQGLANNTLKEGNIFAQVLKESVVSIINASIISLVVFVYNFFMLGDRAITASVSLSLFAVVLFASIFGTLVPLLLDKMKVDPALATGPFITISNDIIGMLIYMFIASALM